MVNLEIAEVRGQIAEVNTQTAPASGSAKIVFEYEGGRLLRSDLCNLLFRV